MGLWKRESKPEVPRIVFGQSVQIQRGFYIGLRGHVVEERFGGNTECPWWSYRIRLDASPIPDIAEIWVHQSGLEA